jgi:hypothetical protein
MEQVILSSSIQLCNNFHGFLAKCQPIGCLRLYPCSAGWKMVIILDLFLSFSAATVSATVSLALNFLSLQVVLFNFSLSFFGLLQFLFLLLGIIRHSSVAPLLNLQKLLDFLQLAGWPQQWCLRAGNILYSI